MKPSALFRFSLLLFTFAANAATNLVSNTAIVTNRVQSIVTYTMSNGVARVQDPSGRLVGTAEERALKVAAEGQVDIASAAADAAGTAMEEWREFTATTDVKVVYIDAGFSQDLPALAPNLCGWVAGSFYDREKGEDHYYVWFNREIDYPPSMCARIVSESGTNWLDGAWVDWAVTNWIDKATGREWARPYSAEVEYLENHGTEWIDTGVAGFINASARFAIPSPIAGRHTVLVGRFNNSGYNRAYTIYLNGGRFYRADGAGWGPYSNSPTVQADQMVDVEVVTSATNLTLSALGVTMSSGRYQSKLTHTLFADVYNRETEPVIYEAGTCRIAFVQIRDTSDNILRDFLLVLDLAGRPAMYDRVSGELFYNSGTGEFSYGPVTAAPVPCRELVIPRRNANCVLKTGTVITLGGKDGFDADIHKVNIEVGGTPAVTTSAQLPLFYAVTRSGTNRTVRAYTNGFLNVENGFIKEPTNE